MTNDDREPSAADEPADPHGSADPEGSDPGSRSLASQEPPKSVKKRKLPVWLETIVLFASALALALIIKTFFVQPFYIPSESMEPGLVENDRILVQKVSGWFGGEPERGDVIVFQDPGGWLGLEPEPTNLLIKAMSKIGLYPTGGHLVKRVIGVGGDTIVCCDDQGRLTVNGEPLDEGKYARAGTGRGGRECYGPQPSQCEEPWTVGPIPEGKLFMMGDNRAHSADSSVHLADDPFIDTDLVVGRVFVLMWPWAHRDWLTRPDAFKDVPDAG